MRSRATPSRISVGERVGALGAVGKASVRGLPHVGCFGCEARVPCVRVVGWSGEGAWVRVAAGWVGAVCALRTIARLPSYLFGWGGSRRRLLSGVLVGWWVGHLVLGPAALAPSAPGVSG